MTDRGLPSAAVPAAFDAGAAAYDRLVGANPGYHRHLRMSAQRMRVAGPRTRTAPARRGLRHRRIDRGAAGGRPRRPRSSPSTRRRECSPRPPPKQWPVDGPVRAQPHRGHRRRRRRRTVRRHLRRVPAAQPRRPGRPIADVPNAVAARARRSRCTSTRCGTPGWPRAMWNAVCCDDHHPDGQAAQRRRHAVPLPAAQRQRLRRRRRLPKPAADQRLHRRAQRDDAGLAAQHRAHVPRRRHRDDRPATRQPPAPPRPARCARAGDARRTSWWSGAGIAGLAAATGLAERGVTVDVVERETLPRRPRRRLDRERSTTAPTCRDEPRLPRVLPAVLQPAGPVAPHRLRA